MKVAFTDDLLVSGTCLNLVHLSESGCEPHRSRAGVFVFRWLIVILCCASALAVLAQDARYEVRLALDPDDDPAVVARQLAATYRVRLESDERSSVLVVSASEASARLLSKDRRVTLVQPVPTAVTATGFGTYAYDGSGNIVTAGADTFVYDKLGRIHRSSIAGVEQTFTYDRHGNITRIATTGESGGDIAVGTGNKLAAATYDASGNLVSYHGGTFVYDGLNVVTESTPAGGNRHLYIYTASNERLATIELLPGGQQQSEWTLRDPEGRVLRRLAKSANGIWSWKEDYIYRGSLLLAAEVPTPEKVRQFHLDHLGTPRLITGNGGAKLAERAYGAFGRGLAVAPSGIHEDLEFTGHERDSFQLDYMHARYYDPMMGRFLSVDPGADWDVHQPQSWNMYSYVRNNPVNVVDPDGRNVALAIRIVRFAGPPIIRYAFRETLRLAGPTVVKAATDYYRHRTSDYAHPVLLPPGAMMESATKPGSANGDTAGKRFPKSVQEQAADEARDADGQTHCQICGVATSEPGEEPVEGEIRSNTDHIIPASQGGDATIDNAQHTCETCNKSGGAKPKPRKTGADKLREQELDPK